MIEVLLLILQGCRSWNVLPWNEPSNERQRWTSYANVQDASKSSTQLLNLSLRERSGSVVECLTIDQGAAGSSLTGVIALLSLSKTHLS